MSRRVWNPKFVYKYLGLVRKLDDDDDDDDSENGRL